MVPAVGASSVPRTCKSVDLPTPEAPTTEAISPGARSKSSPRRTSIIRPPCSNALVRPRTVTRAPPRASPSNAAGEMGVVMGCAKLVGAPAGVNDAIGLIS